MKNISLEGDNNVSGRRVSGYRKAGNGQNDLDSHNFFMDAEIQLVLYTKTIVFIYTVIILIGNKKVMK